MKRCRLIFTEECNRNCPGCCNKQYNFNGCASWDWDRAEEWSMVLITGGEPMLFPNELYAFLMRTGAGSILKPPHILYTADCHDLPILIKLLKLLNGLTLTLHEQKDVLDFRILNSYLISARRF